MIDCSTSNNGCGGGLSSKALQYVQSVGGQMSRASYPYTGVNGKCKFSSSEVSAKISAVSGVPHNDGSSFLSSGPIAGLIEASINLLHYAGGIFNGNCGHFGRA